MTTRSMGSFAAERMRHAGEGPRRPHACIEVKRLAQADQRRERDVIRQPGRPADGAQKDGVEWPQCREEIVRRDRAVPIVMGHAPVEALVVQAKPADLRLDRREHRHRGVDDLRADAVPGIESNAIGRHRCGSMLHRMGRSNRLPLRVLAAWLLVAGISVTAASAQTPASAPADRFAIPATDEGLPGAGPIRRYDWFQKLWRDRRTAWAAERARDQGAWSFSAIRSRRGGEARRGLPRREDRQPRHQRRHDAAACSSGCRTTCWRSKPAARRAADRHQRPRRRARRRRSSPATSKLILAEFKRHNPRMPVILCQVFPSFGDEEAARGSRSRRSTRCIWRR